jgi:poly(3-hydroxybutyrate) depolymerase
LADGGSGSTWRRENDETLVAIVRATANVFRADPRRIHVTGFSRGGFVTWRLLCDYADLFASAAPAAAGTGAGDGETTCFSGRRVPSRDVPILFLMGRHDQAVRYSTMVDIRDAALRRYGLSKPAVIASDASYAHTRWTGKNGVVVETLEHSYETNPGGPWGSERGHCIPGSTFSPTAPRYALPCVGPNAFNWGEEVVRFFERHQKP